MSNALDLTKDLVVELHQICRDRMPTEACGIMLPTSHHGRYIFEMPNRSLKPQTSFDMQVADIWLSVGEWLESNSDLVSEVTFWHSHPSGDPNPSRPDLHHRIDGARNLVLVATPDKELLLTWY